MQDGIPGASVQLTLPNLDPLKTRVENTYIDLARTWRSIVAGVAPGHPLPRRADEIALAALLLAGEHGTKFGQDAWHETTENRRCCSERVSPWIDELTWRLANFDPHNLDRELAFHDLIRNLNHHNSAVRIWMMEIAWIVRARLSRDAVGTRLLENVAATIAGVELAWGLDGVLFDTEEAFLHAANTFAPADFVEQYAARIASFKEQPLVHPQAEFWQLEAHCRRLIVEAALNA